MTSNHNKPIKTHSWPLIIFLLIIFWPVGVYFLVRKLSVDKIASLSSGRKMTIWGWIIAGMGVISWTSLIEDGFIDGTLGMLFFVFLGLTLVYLGKKSSIRAAKYKRYIDIIVNKRVRSIPTISSAIPVSHDVAIKGIQEMINKGFFEDAYINYNQDIIIFSTEDEIDERVRNHKIEMIVVPCNGCGANNQVEKGRVEKCQYCGSLISG
ncbi:hypothetical protein JSQ81_19560 [Sporosarcina sp. Marseille-Q4063]|uniref:hypothetical protein n=1 Tax=Sporosarcina sp. Marseille-Q4063 TaxID=2810514 RepID=UPI001BAF68D8|nr:hypothetical protein [Sporosarcina sp. Marseille-Q4063]QUW21937.1 hypothetical protein JSQ81_19560 [Sporosarcina sp. Marseille-Q4063]